MLPERYKHLKGTYLGEMMEAEIIKFWIRTIFKALVGFAIIAASIKYILE